MAVTETIEFDLDLIDRLITDEEASLEPKHRASIEYRTVAERMHTTEHGARQRAYRAMQALRAALRKPAAGTEDAEDDDRGDQSA